MIEIKKIETTVILPQDHFIIYNGVKVHWFIGDWNSYRAEKLGLTYTNEEGHICSKTDNGACWEAWGSCNGRAYQMFAWFDSGKRQLSEIMVNPKKQKYQDDKGNTYKKDAYYFHQETYDLLTKDLVDAPH